LTQLSRNSIYNPHFKITTLLKVQTTLTSVFGHLRAAAKPQGEDGSSVFCHLRAAAKP
jgi:hypothetical protein